MYIFVYKFSSMYLQMFILYLQTCTDLFTNRFFYLQNLLISMYLQNHIYEFIFTNIQSK